MPNASIPGPSAGRFEELDSLRAIAALGVICWHYVNAFKSAPFGHVLAPFYGRGLLMVDFFFVLSGFVLAKAFWTDGRSVKFGENLVARVARIYPLHLAMLIFVALLQWALVHRLNAPPFVYVNNDAYNFTLNLLLLNGSGLQNGYSFNAPSWSISTEMIVNVVFLALIVMPRKAASVAMTLVAAAAIATVAVRGVLNGTMAFGWIDNELVRTAAGFFVGVGTYALFRRIRPLPSIAADLVVVVVSAAAYVYMATPGITGKAGDFLLCLVGFPVLIIAVVHSRMVKAVLSTRPLVYLGALSYSIYLVHFPLQLSIHLADVSGLADPNYASRWFFVLFIGLVIAVAHVTYRAIEMPGKAAILRAFASRRSKPTRERAAADSSGS
ncbi:acyltransferase family protein [Lysobacter capsici]|uniref:acyltransferase family protein n=1 Tax=Lysobacter capsici TaxID=435897 RepID=UPI001C00698E|nr:acyltransferase [Lysobacter capsici]QWF19054.1 acyltransferase [Lysobacter capsici]